jgi:hypothetical protein
VVTEYITFSRREGFHVTQVILRKATCADRARQYFLFIVYNYEEARFRLSFHQISWSRSGVSPLRALLSYRELHRLL